MLLEVLRRARHLLQQALDSEPTVLKGAFPSPGKLTPQFSLHFQYLASLTAYKLELYTSSLSISFKY